MLHEAKYYEPSGEGYEKRIEERLERLKKSIHPPSPKGEQGD
jgi:hypothetical protein